MVTTTFCVSGAVIVKAGANANSTLTAGNVQGNSSAADEYVVDEWITEAESYINTLTNVNWTDLYSTLNNDVKFMLREAAANLAAIHVINYDMSGYTSITEAQTMMNVLWDSAERNITALRDVERRRFIKDA